jgi:hypothetical protein
LGTSGPISPGSSILNYGESRTFTFYTNLGQHVADLIVDNNAMGPLPSYTFTSDTAAHCSTIPRAKIIHNQDLYGKTLLHHGAQFLERRLDAAVAGNQDSGFIVCPQACVKGAGKPEPHADGTSKAGRAGSFHS